MLRLLSILALASYGLALPSPQQDLNGLISDVFKPPPPQNQAQPAAAPDLDSLIADIFNTNATTASPGVILGSQNQPTTGSSGVILGTQNKPTARPDNCECVPYYQCRDGKILDNGIGLIDIRSGFDSNENQGVFGPCENYLDVCCKPPDVTEDRITPPPIKRTGCGQRHPEGVGFRITGQQDNEAQFGEFPWMVAILREETINQDGQPQTLKVYQCGGALIHTKVVLTAAHCVNEKRPSELKIRAGEWDTQTKNEIFPHQDRSVESIVIHKRFHSGTLANDYALLFLDRDVDLAENVDIVCLPEQNAVFDTSRCFASGWGKDIFGKEGHYQVILKKIDLPVVPRNTCQSRLRTTRLGNYFRLDQSFICAGGEAGKDTCKGDGGSPLVCPLENDPSRYVQAGIVAWGIDCGQADIPGVYASVAGARQWIDEQMTSRGLDTTSYQYSP